MLRETVEPRVGAGVRSVQDCACWVLEVLNMVVRVELKSDKIQRNICRR